METHELEPLLLRLRSCVRVRRLPEVGRDLGVVTAKYKRNVKYIVRKRLHLVFLNCATGL